MTLFDEMVEAGARAAEPQFWATDGVLKRDAPTVWLGSLQTEARKIRLKQSRACLLAALRKMKESWASQGMCEAVFGRAVTDMERAAVSANVGDWQRMLSALIEEGERG